MPRTWHKFHLVDKSPWPLLLALQLFTVVILLTGLLHGFSSNGNTFFKAVAGVVLIMGCWFENVFAESNMGYHKNKVRKSLRFGFVLFIVSEIMFFLSFFWTYFHFALSPTVQIGSVWPPFEMPVLDYLQTPLLNTIILLSSGAAITLAHIELTMFVDRNLQMRIDVRRQYNELVEQYVVDSESEFWSREDDEIYWKKKAALKDNPNIWVHRYYYVCVWLIVTLILAVWFTYNQGVEYIDAPFGITDGIYASIFYMLTGFHGFHVMVGTIFLCVVFVFCYRQYFSRKRHFSFEAGAWYWHFVDVVWIYLYLLLYVKL